jgi:cellulose biosynthesis protein BcsQ
MISIAFFNNKGGVGKTTLLCNIAASLAKNPDKKTNHKVLVIDADPQCNASAYLLPSEKLDDILISGHKNSIDSFFDPIRKGQGYSQNIPAIEVSERFGVDLIVGDPKLSIREDLLATDWASTVNGEPRGFQTTYAFKELLSRLDDYDFVLVDLGPSLGALNRSALLAVDYFLMPLSVDIFSLMAVSNILRSFNTWKNSLEDALHRYEVREGSKFTINEEQIKWDLKFAGFVKQQYRAKKKEGIRQAVVAYERISQKQSAEVEVLCSFFGLKSDDAYLGEIPTLSSVIPLSQQAHAPVFDLGSKDGIVGSGYNQVSEAGSFYHKIADNLLSRVGK